MVKKWALLIESMNEFHAKTQRRKESFFSYIKDVNSYSDSALLSVALAGLLILTKVDVAKTAITLNKFRFMILLLYNEFNFVQLLTSPV